MDRGRYGPRSRNHGILPQWNTTWWWPKFLKIEGYTGGFFDPHPFVMDRDWMEVEEDLVALTVKYHCDFTSSDGTFHWSVVYTCLTPAPSISIVYTVSDSIGSSVTTSLPMDLNIVQSYRAPSIVYPPSSTVYTGAWPWINIHIDPRMRFWSEM